MEDKLATGDVTVVANEVIDANAAAVDEGNVMQVVEEDTIDVGDVAVAVDEAATILASKFDCCGDCG